ncbi:hypothetical protein ACRRTK_003254 [Alexandromys fortis]
MEGFMDSGTQTDTMVVLSLAQAAVLGLVSENELFGATISAEAFYPDLGPELSGTAVGEPGPPGPDIYQLACNGRALEEPLEEEVLEVEAAFEKHTRRKTRPPCGWYPRSSLRKRKRKRNRKCMSAFSRKPRTLRHLPRTPRPELDMARFDPPFPNPTRDSFPEPSMALPGPETLPTECGFEPPHLAPLLSSPDPPPMTSPELVKPEQGFVWQESSEFEADPVGSTVERHKKAQLDRLDINVQIDDSYLLEAGDRQKRWQCRMCEKSYTFKYNLVTHILGHNGIKPHSCPHCSKLFKQPSHLQTHLLTHQGTRPHSASHLKRHMLLHSEVKPYSCHFCGRGVAYPSELKAHEVKHESGRCHGPTLYQCLECDKSFHYRSQLQNHMLKHQNVRPFVCTECYMGMKEFKCEVCGREFTLQANMKRHMLIHTSVRPYQCRICFKTFVRKQTLKTHMICALAREAIQVQGSKPLKCPYCSSRFNVKGNLSRHMKVKHGIMDISLDSQDPMMELAGPDPSELDSQQEMEDLEENAYTYTSVDTSTEASALTEKAMKEMAYYNVL